MDIVGIQERNRFCHLLDIGEIQLSFISTELLCFGIGRYINKLLNVRGLVSLSNGIPFGKSFCSSFYIVLCEHFDNVFFLKVCAEDSASCRLGFIRYKITDFATAFLNGNSILLKKLGFKLIDTCTVF